MLAKLLEFVSWANRGITIGTTLTMNGFWISAYARKGKFKRTYLLIGSRCHSHRVMSNNLLKCVCKAMERIAPVRLAEKWDNVGLLLESPIQKHGRKKIMLTIDLTTPVFQESLEKETSVIVAYHPPIFKGLQSITLSNPLQSSLLQCAASGISVYSPHTALDSVWDGINDWLAEGLMKSKEDGEIRALVREKLNAATGECEGGEGRLVTLREPIGMDALERRIKSHLKLSQIQVGYPSTHQDSGPGSIRSIAICAGSGGSMLVGQDADLYLTGEMSHHEVLAAVGSGKHVVLCGHTNTERGYLSILAQKLITVLHSEEFKDEALDDVEVMLWAQLIIEAGSIAFRLMSLALDLSTQQLKAILLDRHSNVIHHFAVHFDRELPHHRTINGAIQGPDKGEVTSPVHMWLEAVDLLFARLRREGVDLGAVMAVSGAGQQHGSVYWSTFADSLLSSLDPDRQLADQLFPKAFSYRKAPIWQDSSTAEDCERLEDEFGGPEAVADRTGSRAYQRFTGNQISRIRRLKPDVYDATTRISLVSSFLASLFLGRVSPIEISDASGMNLMDIITYKWDDWLLDICGGPTLRSKLGPEPVPTNYSLGKVCDWWVRRWGFNPECIVGPFTGDNPATLVSFSEPGDAILSLGTSTTFLLSVPPSDTPPKRYITSHLLAHPTSSSGKIVMLCYKNGALARESIRDRYAGGNWLTFNELVETTPAGCNGLVGFYFPLPEIIPSNVTGEFFFTTSHTTTADDQPLRVNSIPDSVHPRAILESQLLSIRSRVRRLLPDASSPLRRLVLSGGGSANQVTRQLTADIFNLEVYVSLTEEGACYGGALLAKYLCWNKSNTAGLFEDMMSGEDTGLICVARPRLENAKVYGEMVHIYEKCEQRLLEIWKG